MSNPPQKINFLYSHINDNNSTPSILKNVFSNQYYYHHHQHDPHTMHKKVDREGKLLKLNKHRKG